MTLSGIGLAILLGLIVFGAHSLFRTSRKQQEESAPAVKQEKKTPSVSPAQFIVVPSSSHHISPQIPTPTMPPTVTQLSVRPPIVSLASSPSPQPQVPSFLPRPSLPPPSEPDNEALRWAKRQISLYLPKWHIHLTKSVDAKLGNEGFAVIVEPNNIEVSARSQSGWLYGLLEVAERLVNGEPLPNRLRWEPPMPQRGLVEPVTAFIPKGRVSQRVLSALIRMRLQELALRRLNLWVLEARGSEPFLPELFKALQASTHLYGVRVVFWSPMTRTMRLWTEYGGQIVVPISMAKDGSQTIPFASEPKHAFERLLSEGVVLPLQNGQFFTPQLPPYLSSLSQQQRERVIFIGGLEGAHEMMFWFDPTFAHQLVQAMRNAKVSGFWLIVRSIPIRWGIMAFGQAFKIPDADGEKVWVQKWQPYWKALAHRWVETFREASRIIPELVWLLGTEPENGQPFRPQFGVSLDAFFTRHPVSKVWGVQVLSVPETITFAPSPNSPPVQTAKDIQYRLHQRAQEVLNALSALPESKDQNWQTAKRAALLNAWIGKHFAYKIDAALALANFSAGDSQAGQECITALNEALKAWKQAVSVADTLYPPNHPWAKRLAKWHQELESYRARILTPSLP